MRLTQSQFAPVEITPEFWIVPTWHEPPAQARQVIRLDPGLAFGTGTHPTTRMCLRWIAQHPPTGQRVLDYGCGSGILAIGGARYGAAQIDAVDIDPAAVESTRANAQANGVQLNAGLPDQAMGQYQVVLANILATPLKLLAPLLCSLVAPGGSLVLAGILERQADELKAAYAPLHRAGRVRHGGRLGADDGIALAARRRAGPRYNRWLMSLITRCPACGTMFKVVPDQLRISEGWVRCGHCAEIFDAAAHLQPDEKAEPPRPSRPLPRNRTSPRAMPAPESEVFSAIGAFRNRRGAALGGARLGLFHEEAQALRETPLDQPFELRRQDSSEHRGRAAGVRAREAGTRAGTG